MARDLLQIHRGTKGSIPTLTQGEFGFTYDTEELYIGGMVGNVKVGGKDSLISVKDFGAKGDGITDDTIAIQSAIDSMQEGTVLIFPAGEYLRGVLTVADKSNIIIDGLGSLHILSGADASIKMEGVCDNLVFQNLNILGDAVVLNAHHGFSNLSGQTLSNITIRNCKFKDVTIGVSVNADISGTIENIVIENNIIENVYGIGTGEGYGIHLSNFSPSEPSMCKVLNNTIVNAYRHSIYIARGSDYVVKGNSIKDHRANASDKGSAVRSAINISRSKNVLVDGNMLNDCYVGIMVTSDSGGYGAENINISNNVIKGGQFYGDINVGYLDPSLYDVAYNINIIGNIVKDGIVPCVTLNYGKNVKVNGNLLDVDGQRTILINSEEDGVGTADYSDEIVIENNILKGSNIYRFKDFATSIVKCLFLDNVVVPSSAIFSSSVVVTNPNMKIVGHTDDGISYGVADLLNAYDITVLAVGNGADGTFTTVDAKTVTVVAGVITNIV